MKKCILGLCLVALSGPAAAVNQNGWYSSWETLLNLIWPPKADRKVTSAERQGDYPLLGNPSDFDDGFQPGLYGFWQEIKLSPATGALCGNGTPFKFYLRRVANNRNYNINLEPGGACWDYASCSGQTGIRGARNPNGIPDNYINQLDVALLTPFVTNIHYADHFEAQQWNTLFIPYCTGDVHAGNKTAVYTDPTGQNPPLTWHHNGQNNIRAVIAWLRDHLQRPTKMLTTGCSAGGTGALVNYQDLRRSLAPSKGYLINDSGPIFNASSDADPSYRLHLQIRDAWGLDPTIQRLGAELPGFSLTNLGTLYAGLAAAHPQDRLAEAHFYQDLNYSSYSYERFYDDIANEPNKTLRQQKILAKWHQDTENLIQELDQPALSNWAYYIPYYRALNESHCTTIVEFKNSDVQEDPLQPELGDFVNRVMDDSQPMLSAVERDTQADYNKPFNAFYALLNLLLGVGN